MVVSGNWEHLLYDIIECGKVIMNRVVGAVHMNMSLGKVPNLSSVISLVCWVAAAST